MGICTLDYSKHCKGGNGTYCQINEEKNSSNMMVTQTKGVIFIGTSNKMKGF